MNDFNQNNDNFKKSHFVTILAWAVIIFYSVSSIYSTHSAFKDIAHFKNNVSSSFFIYLLPPLIIILALFPIVFAIGLLIRKNWGRLGVMTICLLSIAKMFYSISFMKALYPQQMVWILFHLSLFFVLKSKRIRKEFVTNGKEKV
jgi:hypothetical protein